jgi:hypothetical protein
MQEIINKSQQLTALLIEYRESLKYQSCLYHVDKQPDRQNMFFLIEIKTGEIKRTGTPEQLKGWLRLRKIEPDKVYNYSLLPAPIIKIDDL